MKNSKYKLCDSVFLLPDEEKEARKQKRETHIIANLGNDRYLVAGYGPPVTDMELSLISKFRGGDGGC